MSLVLISTLTVIQAQKKKKNFKIYLIKKLISHLNVQANKTKDEKPFGFNSWSDSKTLV